MLSFELSAIDIVLVLSVIVLLILYITKSSSITPKETKSPLINRKKNKSSPISSLETLSSRVTYEEKKGEQPVEKSVKKRDFNKFISSSKNSANNLFSNFKKPLTNESVTESSDPQRTYTVVCPKGFGNLQLLGGDNSVSQKCLGCPRIMDCYLENRVEN